MIPGAEAIGLVLIVLLVMGCLALLGIAAVVWGLICIFGLKKKKAGIWIAGAGSCVLILLFLVWRVMNPSPKEFTVSIDLRNPMDKSGIPTNVRWLKDSRYFEADDGKFYPDDYWICEASGKVSLKVILPDGKTIEETVYSIITEFRNTNGFYHLQIDGLEKINQEQALEKFQKEYEKWSVGALNQTNIQPQLEATRAWVMGNARTRASFFTGLYFHQDAYAISSDAVHDLLDESKFSWRYSITMASALPNVRKK